MDNLIIVAAAIVVVIVLILITGYVKAPTDTAVIISGLKKEPKYVIGRSSIKIPFLQRTDKLTLKMISVDVKLRSRFQQMITLMSTLIRL